MLVFVDGSATPRAGSASIDMPYLASSLAVYSWPIGCDCFDWDTMGESMQEWLARAQGVNRVGGKWVALKSLRMYCEVDGKQTSSPLLLLLSR